jgi:hypothetical protein
MRSTVAPVAADDPSPASLLLGAVRGWDRFWFSPEDPTTLCFIRLAAGLLIFYVHLTYSWSLLSYVGPEAWLSASVADHIRKDAPIMAQGLGWDVEIVPYSKGNFYWSVFYHLTDPAWIVAFHVFFLAAMLAMAVGLWTRTTAVLSWIGAMCYVQRASITVFGLDAMMMILLLYLMIGPCGAVLSIDRWLAVRRARRDGRPPEPVRPSYSGHLAIRLLQVHFCFIYLAAGTSKLLGSTWWSGTSLNLIMLNPEFAPLDYGPYYHAMKFLAGHRWLWESFMAVQIVGTLFLEIGFPFLVWDRRLRWAAISGSVMLHTGIAVFMGLTTFSLMMICMVASFIPPEVVREQLARLTEPLGRLFAARAAAAPAEKGELVLTR